MKRKLLLIRRELLLDAHPTMWIFLMFAGMTMIPNYPYHVGSFYTTLAIFFTCLGSRENNSIEFSLELPIERREVVSGRIMLALFFEVMQLALTAMVVPLRMLILAGNAAGLDAGPALVGSSALMLGLFNLVFFPRYFARPDAPGSAYIVGTVVTFGYVFLVDGAAIAVSALSPDFALGMPLEFALCAVGVAAFAVLTFAADRISNKRFARIDL